MASLYRIQVKVKEGRNLVAKDRDLLGRKTSSDPYVELYFGHRLIGTTDVIEKTLNPVWRKPRFDWVVGFGSLDKNQGIELRIWDKDLLSADDPMGTVFVIFPDIPCDVESWFPVGVGIGELSCPNATGAILAKIRVESVKFSEVGSSVLVSSSALSVASSREEFFEAQMRIEVDVKEGRNLVAKDRNILGRKTSSDPYVELYFGSEVIGKTEVIEKTLNPVWEHGKFDWVVGAGTLERKKSIELRIWDKDLLSADDPMGNVFVIFPHIPCNIEQWFPVGVGVGKYSCPNSTGEMLMKIKITVVKFAKAGRSFDTDDECDDLGDDSGSEIM